MAGQARYKGFFDEVNAAALARYPALLFEWFPAGHMAGSEFECGDIEGNPGKSFKVNPQTGKWADFAGNVRGGDPVSLFAAKEGLKQGEAAARLGRLLGIEPPKLRSVGAIGSKDDWTPIVPVPACAPAFKVENVRHQERPPSMYWEYRDASGALLAYRVRFDESDNGAKVVVPYTYCENAAGWRGWQPKDLPAPRTLYNVDKLVAQCDAPVLVVEGEKTAEAAETLLAPKGWVVVTWPGGSNRVSKKNTVWAPLVGRKVWIWPDHDKAGREATLEIAQILAASKPAIIKPDPGWDEGYDIADLVDEGWDAARVLDWIEKQSASFDEGLKDVRVAVGQDRGVAQADIFVADKFLAKYQQDIRYCPTRGWLIWDGRRWAWDEREAIMKLVEQTVRDLYREAADIDNEKDRNQLIEFAKKHSRVERIRGALAVARPHVAVIQRELDRDGFALNCRNGTIDLRDGSIRPPDRAYLITKLIDIDYQADAEATRFEQFLLEIFDGKTDLVDYLQRAIGYSFTASQGEQCLHFLHGKGANGKSTLIEVLLKVASEYGQVAPAEMVLLRHGDPIPTDIARLCGARFVAINETGEARALDEAVVKKLTSSEPIPARYLHRDYFEFAPTHHLWLSSNHKPHISGTDLGIWRRIRLIPFTQTFEQNDSLADDLAKEAAGILAWIVRGAVTWYVGEGLVPPAEVAAATAQYRSEQDVLEEILSENFEVGDYYEVTAKEAYDTYKKIAQESGEARPWSKKMFGRRLADRGFVPLRVGSSSTRVWRGLRTKI